MCFVRADVLMHSVCAQNLFFAHLGSVRSNSIILHDTSLTMLFLLPAKNIRQHLEQQVAALIKEQRQQLIGLFVTRKNQLHGVKKSKWSRGQLSQIRQ